MKHRFVVPGLILIGICLLMLGTAWNQIVPSSAYWTAEKAEEFSAAQTELHAHLDDGPNHDQKLSRAKDRFIKIRDELEGARGTRSRMKTAITILGAGILLVAIMIHLSARQNG